ncbi:HPr(Ser) kinase/phosphatase [bacterium]|nr:HPr(Ser) kinase/phosphatase [bacterium]NIN92412.1 HPr(Ser) kinase/phosphatase [bacterium]NIO18526.1 HPr(Ser) kinase/phosphatase [bacterium]NIO73522.1 HPr(Ser) kinase/phosphatase [bacterium]
MAELEVKELLEEKGADLDLHLVGGEEGLNRKITSWEIHSLGLALSGEADILPPGQLQILDREELDYLKKLNSKEKSVVLRGIFSKKIPCFIVTSNFVPPRGFIEMAQKAKVPVFKTSISVSTFVNRLLPFLEDRLTLTKSVQGVMVEVYGLGILILGVTGIGKSECALELVNRGHRLIAGEVVGIKQRRGDILIGFAKEPIRYYLEVQGLGIVDVQKLFGASVVRSSAKIDLVIVLEEWDKTKDYELLGFDQKYTTILEVNVPELVIPIRPGRNMAGIIEVAAMNQRLRREGYSAISQLDKEIIKITQRKKEKK